MDNAHNRLAAGYGLFLLVSSADKGSAVVK